MSPSEPISSPARAPVARAAPALRRLLVGIDGSDAAGAACAFALRLAGRAGAEVLLLHACPDLEYAAHAPAEAFLAAAGQRRAEAAEWQRRLDNLRSYAAGDAAVESRVARGSPAGAIVAQAIAGESDLILLGSTGAGPLRGALRGSVSSQIVEHAPCSVMLFRAGHPASPAHVRSIVAGVDGSPGSLDAVALAAQLARPLDAKLVLFTAYGASPLLTPPTLELHAQLERHAVEVLRSARAAVAGDREVVAESREGRSRETLLDACVRYGPAVLVVGPHLGGFRGLPLGGTSRWLLNHAVCPVVVARRRRTGVADE